MAASSVVKRIEDEYHYIAAHRFECACTGKPPLLMQSHGIDGKPKWLMSLVGMSIWLSDFIHTECSVCHGRFTYQFDVRRLEHIWRWRGLGGLYVMTLDGVLDHMKRVMDVQSQLAKRPPPGLVFPQQSQ